MNYIPYLILFLSAIMGGFIGLLLEQKKSKQFLGFILPFSGAFLLGIAVLHMLPEVFHYDGSAHFTGIFILMGFLIQIFLEFLSKGIEHGHVHFHKGHKSGFLFSIMFGLCVHAFLEGMPVHGIHSAHEGHTHSAALQPYVWGIAVHKLPAAIALSVLLLYSGVKKSLMFVLLIIFALMSPLGSLSAVIFDFTPQVQNIILAIAIGSVLHVATIIIFETDENSHHKISFKKLLAVVLGFGISLISTL